MERNALYLCVALVGGIAAAVIGCGSGSGSTSSPVTIQKADGYYNVTLDYANTSHREMGRQYALAINNVMPTYAQTVDGALAIQMGYLESVGLTFGDMVARANALFNSPNFYSDYKDEIQGMQEVFNYGVDTPGDGKLSKNELLVFQLFPDVMRVTSCSASAAFGSASVSGKPVIGRNLDWVSALNESASQLHSLTAFKNGSKTVANFGMLGQLSGASIFNTSRVFGAVLDAETGADYPASDLANRRSYMFDLRYALENFTTLNDVSNFMRAADHLYAYNHLIFLSDASTAGVLENETNYLLGSPTSNRSLRTDTSALQPMPSGQNWGILGAFATVNDYRLVNNVFTDELYNTARWSSFKSKYALVPAGQKIDINSMKSIAGYPASNGYMVNGAIFVSEPFALQPPGTSYLPYPAPGLVGAVPQYTTIQSILVDMGTMDLWAHFVPSQASVSGQYPPREPTYRKVPNPIY